LSGHDSFAPPPIPPRARRRTNQHETLRVGVFSNDGRLILTSSLDATARLWDAGTGQLLHVLGDSGGIVTVAAFSPDGRLVLTGSKHGIAKLWDIQTRAVLHAVGRFSRDLELRAVAFSPDGHQILTSGLALGPVPSRRCTKNVHRGTSPHRHSSYVSGRSRNEFQLCHFSPHSAAG